MTLDTTNEAARAIAMVRAKFTNPVVLPQKRRKEFNIFLYEQFGNPADDAWKEADATEELENDKDFYLVEYFTTPAGPMAAVHFKDYPNPVLVVVNAEAARKMFEAECVSA
ncbi:hypothetical protein [Pseudotabrizicola alkalilacus]|uniref:Uncharacterized protein n=1 Tax=Pseudotabrizicola alkalilacus TaxID=2305252 RepID=A0A411Z3P9_9RHOB|nr:hypothetical protein [Pseudotabrizicola alkalilacus]RGP37689.1 hypothetical protein D1012_07155 [Pseudotabrizicola alkalilacus]